MKKQRAVILLSVIGVLIAGALVWFNGYNPYDWGDYRGWSSGRGHMRLPGMGVMMLLFWALVLFGLILLINWLSRLSGADTGAARGPGAVEILKQRYARGEIDRTGYERILDDLTRPLPKISGSPGRKGEDHDSSRSD